ncbi:probable ADP-ribosylation factor GTPase-activating protein AGD14 [Cornus florida]|uniref:probable ADP-ribosylation factor GTPase-activating protein AGD14 n=1 Tax=Cornus florida TaxID=4283 RepID=UPI002898E56C|nr:probable ADP-ribosylation factor GTPase-activating protein AGD14 [Cornus florida]XP_059634981.1 probable ADP-ribosylation factor GTPase-activating protein AGD14 [Cornus florida]XP_059634982.1 probable ADP-ribosylation factor GTPase-activating protein AGD14 [Cornus florida]XP_059634983.1 probable ADP-ribosylation factor GTPase-activating protein AGD14 [Cornus florida]
MANRAKEDEKNEKTIRNLLKLTENRRCINCNSLGPQYVCTNFWTFVCTTCSGIHREFTHRVKSVSMAKFTSQEVSALQGAGNMRAKEIYFKEWDPQRNPAPDSSNIERLRDFIKHVYVDRRYTGERSFDKPPRVNMGENEDSYENRRIDASRGGSRSPPYEDSYERRYSDRPSPGGRSDEKNYRSSYDERSPGYDADYRSPARPEVVNDWRREDRFGNGRRSEDGKISDGNSKVEGRSPDRQKDLDMSSPPTVRPIRDILRDNVPPLRIIEPPKPNGGRAADVRTQRTASSSSMASSNGNPAELRRENSGILIDFDAVTEPPVTAAVPQAQQIAIGQSGSQPTTSSNSDNWACFDSVTEVKVSQAPANVNSLESVLSQLTVPATVPGHVAPNSGFLTTEPVGNMSGLPSSSISPVASLGYMSASPFGSVAPSAALVNNFTPFPTAAAGGVSAAAPVGHTYMSSYGGAAPAAPPVNSLMTFPPVGHSVAVPGSTSVLPFNQHSLFSATGSQPTVQPFTPSFGGASSNQPWNSSLAPNTIGMSSVTDAQASQVVSKPALVVASGIVTEPSPVEVRPIGRKELPMDLFAPTYSPAMSIPGWQSGPPRGFVFTTPYNTAMPMPTFQQSLRSTNPFDVNNETSVQAPTFSMASLQGALPNMAASSGLLHTSSLNAPSPTWMSSQLSYPSAIPPQAPSYASGLPSNAYMVQQVPNNLTSRQQDVVGFASGGAAFGSLSSNQQPGGMYSAPATPNTFSFLGGNPFG